MLIVLYLEIKSGFTCQAIDVNEFVNIFKLTLSIMVSLNTARIS